MIELETQDEIVVMRLAHGKVSAFDLELVERIADELDEIEQSSARALILTGTGRTFSAGADLFRILDGGEAYLQRFLPALTRTLVKLYTFPRPVVAAINGHAIAGGCLLACASDYRVMTIGKGTIGAPELVVGVPFPLIALEILRDVIPQHHLSEAIYSGTLYPADVALERGLIDDLVDSARLIDSALKVAKRLSEIPTETFRLTKYQLRRPGMERWEREGEAVDREVQEAWAMPEIQGVILAYLERTLGRTK